MRVLFLLTFVLLSMTSAGQEAVIEKVQSLELLNRAKRVSKYIPMGAKIIAQTEGQRFKGVLTAVDSTSVILGDIAVPIRDIQWIGRKSFASYLRASGLAILGLGLAGTGAVNLSNSEGDGVFNSAIITAAGLGVTGLSWPAFRNGRKFYLDSVWKIMPPK